MKAFHVTFVLSVGFHVSLIIALPAVPRKEHRTMRIDESKCSCQTKIQQFVNGRQNKMAFSLLTR